MLANTMPGKPKMNLETEVVLDEPEKPSRAPEQDQREQPTTTGDTANGRSMTACRALLPRNLLRANTNAVGTPKKDVERYDDHDHQHRQLQRRDKPPVS